MMKSMIAFAVLATACVLAAAVPRPFSDLYADTSWNDLTGFSTYVNARTGVRNGHNDYFVYLRNETYDTRGTDLPFREQSAGTSVGVGYRYWFPGERIFGTVTAGVTVAGSHSGEADLRAGFAGYDAWERGKHYSDLYGEVFWVERADDVLMTVRARPGITLRRDANGRLWTYGVGQGWASAGGDAGTENRVEAGVGLGYISDHGWSASAELRAGYAYRGEITDRTYLNPTITLAGYW
ncbi:MAG: hypothetical protein ACYDBB_26875 [Armatimonadota bacterium]